MQEQDSHDSSDESVDQNYTINVNTDNNTNTKKRKHSEAFKGSDSFLLAFENWEIIAGYDPEKMNDDGKVPTQFYPQVIEALRQLLNIEVKIVFLYAHRAPEDIKDYQEKLQKEGLAGIEFTPHTYINCTGLTKPNQLWEFMKPLELKDGSSRVVYFSQHETTSKTMRDKRKVETVLGGTSSFIGKQLTDLYDGIKKIQEGNKDNVEKEMRDICEELNKYAKPEEEENTRNFGL